MLRIHKGTVRQEKVEDRERKMKATTKEALNKRKAKRKGRKKEADNKGSVK